ncbi:hypothetical protein Tco_0510668 [Tanacetum coccineum]
MTDKLDWNNLEGDRYTFDLSKPLPLQGRPCHLTVAVDYFFNNDLEYLKTYDLEKMYTMSILKTKAAWYEIKGIEEWFLCFGVLSNLGMKMNNVSGKRDQTLGQKAISVTKLHGYDHLEEIVVKRACQHLYKFKKGDFVDLHLNDIEDMLLLAVQHKLFHLNDCDIVDFIVALRMFTRGLVIKKRVKDLQLGKRVMRADELYKLSDGTLKKVQDELHHRVLNFSLGYNDEMSRRKWTAIDRKRSQLMAELIDKQIHERRIIQNLKQLVGARELKMDYKLMTRTV